MVESLVVAVIVVGINEFLLSKSSSVFLRLYVNVLVFYRFPKSFFTNIVVGAAELIHTDFHIRIIRVGVSQFPTGTALSRIIRLVRDAQDSKSPIQKTVDRVSSFFVPAIIAISIASFFIWLALDPSDGFTNGLLAALTVLVIARPCALGVATPTAIAV